MSTPDLAPHQSKKVEPPLFCLPRSASYTEMAQPVSFALVIYQFILLHISRPLVVLCILGCI